MRHENKITAVIEPSKEKFRDEIKGMLKNETHDFDPECIREVSKNRRFFALLLPHTPLDKMFKTLTIQEKTQRRQREKSKIKIKM